MRIRVQFILFCFILTGYSYAQSPIRWIAPESNPRLTERRSAAVDISSQGRSEADYQRIVLPTSVNRTFCFDTVLVNQQLIDQLEDDACEVTEFLDYRIDGLCLVVNTFNVSSVETDRVCVRACNEAGCREFVFDFEVRRPLNIPFFDDFAYEGPYPDPIKWVDRNVYINNHFGVNPPSIGVATFDGLDEFGSPYGGERGRSDYLTSTYLDLSSFRQEDDVYITFYTQAKGNGLRPREADSLILEFRNPEGNWVKITDYTGIPGFIPLDQSPEFSFRLIRITQQYMHRNFQFRYVNINSRTGIQELWHLDYVRVTFGFVPSGNNTDVAFTRPPASFLFPYTAMPKLHFDDNEEEYINTNLPIGLYNHFPTLATAEPSRLILTDVKNGFVISNDLTLLEVPPVVPQNQRNLNPGRHDFLNELRKDTWLNNFITHSRNSECMSIETRYQFTQDQEISQGIPDLIRNNTVSRVTELKDYFAYDDGTAEFGIGVHSNPGNLAQLMVKFTAEKPTYLTAVQMHFPHINENVTNQLFNLNVYIGELKTEPDYSDIFKRPFYADRYEPGFQGFSIYPILNQETLDPDVLFIPPGDFYVGWQQVSVSANDIPVGYDRNSPEGVNYIYFNNGGDWKAFRNETGRIDGSVMLRPVVNELPVTSVDEEKLAASKIRVYPNPSRGLFNIDSDLIIGDGVTYVVYSSLGQVVKSGLLDRTIDLNQNPDGLYSIVFQSASGYVIDTQKILLLR